MNAEQKKALYKQLSQRFRRTLEVQVAVAVGEAARAPDRIGAAGAVMRYGVSGVHVMCHFIKLVLPAQADIPALRDVVKRHGRVLEPISEPRVDRELPRGDEVYLTSSCCDCGTGLANRKSRRREHDEGREVARLRREGWSGVKIQRWREQRGESVVEPKAKSKEKEVEDWRALVSDLLDAKVDHVGLLVHWVTDDVRQGPVLSRASLSTETISNLDENVVYTFTRRP